MDIGKIDLAKREHSAPIAQLHFEAINQGFLPRLGKPFLQDLYKFLIIKEIVISYSEDNEIRGFVSCAISSQGIMKRFILHSKRSMFKIGGAILKNPGLIKPMWETFQAPKRSISTDQDEDTIPTTELLSIAVSTKAQNSGIGTLLIQALEKELKSRNIHRYNVIAGQQLVGANKFYQKNGFKLAKAKTIHGKEVSNVYMKNLKGGGMIMSGITTTA